MKMFNYTDAVDGGLIGTGLVISLQDLQSLLSIIILIVDVLWILFKLIYKLIKYYKDGVLSDEEKKDLMNEIDNITNITKKNNKEGD